MGVAVESKNSDRKKVLFCENCEVAEMKKNRKKEIERFFVVFCLIAPEKHATISAKYFFVEINSKKKGKEQII
ncbi:MAG: hypothetical protein WCS73_05535 [Lentisphaeria bacterium]